jgi:hypothetical protein
MRTKAQAEAVLAALPLSRAVAVTDAAARRRYSYTLPQGNIVEIEIDADPSDQQLDDLAKHLPLNAQDRPAALTAMRASASVRS